MAALTQLENKLDEVLGKKSPVQLPENARKVIVEYLPWINLVIGVFTLWGAWTLWRWAHLANTLVDYANQLSRAIGGTTVAAQRLTVVIWLGLITLAVEGVLMIAAFPGTRDRKKAGWNLLFYAALINVVYGVIILFSDYGGAGRFVGSLIGSVIGLYFLFQIRGYYTGRKSSATSSSKDT